MIKSTLGNTGLEISQLGIGLAEIGHLELDDNGLKQAGLLLNTALDSGINFFDTAECYENSETIVGKVVKDRRQEYILATKCGHLIEDYGGDEYANWSKDGIQTSIERSLLRLQTDYVDLIQLHSPLLDILKKGEAIEELEKLKKEGKTRFIGCSGDNDVALWAAKSGVFDTIQTSFNITDQLARKQLFQYTKQHNLGLIAKRPIANAAWGAVTSPSEYANEYFERAKTLLKLGPVVDSPDDRFVLSIGFVLGHEEINTAIIGTTNSEHLIENVKVIENKLPISNSTILDLHRRFDNEGKNWKQLT